MPLNRNILWVFLCCLWGLCMSASGQGIRDGYRLYWHGVDKDTLHLQQLGLREEFPDRLTCNTYLLQLPKQLQQKGYLAASVDSIRLDSSFAQAWLFVGNLYQWKKIHFSSDDPALKTIAGWNEKQFTGKALQPQAVSALQERILRYYEDNGYPFAKVLLDSLVWDENGAEATIRVEEGPLYHIDSIRVFGKAKISQHYLHQYLGIEKGSIYNRSQLEKISPRLRESSFLRESQNWQLTMLGTGSFLDLYLEPKRSSQANLLIGFLPSNEQLEGNKLLLTGEANILLNNTLGGGETIGLNWQQLQVKSPRLNLLFRFPYLFHTRFGLDLNFDLFKKDTSFLNLNSIVGVNYLSSGKHNGKVYVQWTATNVLEGGIDTAQVKQTKELPPYIDVRTVNLGIDHEFSGTDYRYNPRKGTEYRLNVSGGLRKIRENSSITNLTTDASGRPFDFSSLYDTVPASSYLLRFRTSAAHYLRSGKSGTIKGAVQAGVLFTENPFRNELFQIGGFKILRGFDEESIYADRYAVATLEYRILFGTNNYFFAFTDGGWAGRTTLEVNEDKGYLGFGGGMTLETKAGIFNLTVAAGKAGSAPVDFRRIKVHIGMVSLF